MNFPAPLRRAFALPLILALLSPCFAQQQSATPPAPRATPPVPTAAPPTQSATPSVQSVAPPTAQAAKPQPAATPAAVTFDTLLAADAYAIYGEIRGLGQYINSKEVTELAAPLGLPGGAPPELLDLFNFMRAHMETLMTARVMFATMPTRPQLPSTISVVELSSVEQAQKFERDLRKFLAAHVPPADEHGNPRTHTKEGGSPDNMTGGTTTTTTTTTATTKAAPPPATLRGEQSTNKANAKPAATPTPPPPFQLERVGTLLLVSDTPFTLAALRPADAPLLTEEPGFQAGRARFGHETLFLYFNTKRMERSSAEQSAKIEREMARQREEAARAQKAIGAEANDTEPVLNGGDEAKLNALPPPSVEVITATGANANAVPPGVDASGRPLPTATAIGPEQVMPPPDEPPAAGGSEEEKKLTPEEEQAAQKQRAAQQLFSVLPSLLFGRLNAASSWPESIAAAAELTDSELILRALFISEGDGKPPRPIPFVPLLVSGPALVTEAANVVPADTDILVSASLDLPQMYDYVASALGLLDLAQAGGGQGRKSSNDSFTAQLASFEKANGFRIKEDLLAALGNEIAVAAPAAWFGLRRGGSARGAGEAPRGPVFIIALNDKRALQELLPRALDSVGLKGVTAQQLFEKRGDVELLTLAQGTIAFIDRFLVIAPDAATMRHITDAYNGRETLATSESFRNAGNWEPRQVLGQIYVSNTLLKNAFEDPKAVVDEIEDAAVREVLLRTNAEPGPLTHALTKDDQGMMHELHIPKDLLALATADSLIRQQLGPLRSHEAQAQYALQGLAEAEQAYKEVHGKYASLEELKRIGEEEEKRAAANDDDGDVDTDEVGFIAQAEGYEFKLHISGDKFEATATPTVYRKTGRRSFYIDQTGIVRAADVNGKPADSNAPRVD